MVFKKKIYTLALYIFLLIILLILIKFSTNEAYGKTYKVKDIEIIEPYEISFNKPEIIDKAIKNGFQELIQKITTSNTEKKITNIDFKDIKNLVHSFSIVDEKFINNNYLVKFDIDFNQKSTLKYLEKKNIFSSLPLEKKIFILPILIDLEVNQISLFSENIFYNKWNEENEKYYLLDYILPNEDLEDLNLLRKKINNIEEHQFDEIISKYDLKDYIIVIFFKNKDMLRVLSKVKLNNDLSVLNDNFKNIEITEQKNYMNIISKLKVNYEDQWKKQNLINSSIKLSINLSLDSKNFKLINEFEKKLLEHDLISNFYIYKFNSEKIIYKIIYNSTPDKFLSEIKSSGFEIDTSSEIWKLK